jgi:peptidyl-prolyl cis-trans isomerase A (cyclophilin A)
MIPAFRTSLLPRLTCALFCTFVGTAAYAQQSTTPPVATTPPAQTAPAPTNPSETPAPPDAPTPQAASPALPDSPDATIAPVLIPSGPTVVFDSSMGRMTCKLFSKQAPETTANFIGLATGTKDWTNPATHQKEHNVPLYNGTTFHRVIPGFMIQGGDPVGDGTGDPGYMFNDEIVPGLTFNVPGRLAMANSGPNTNGSQFFITVAPQPTLDGNYSIFGQCDDPTVSVANAIASVERDPNDKPLTPVTLNKVTIVPEGQPLPPVPAAAAVPVAAPATAPPATPQF